MELTGNDVIGNLDFGDLLSQFDTEDHQQPGISTGIYVRLSDNASSASQINDDSGVICQQKKADSTPWIDSSLGHHQNIVDTSHLSQENVAAWEEQNPVTDVGDKSSAEHVRSVRPQKGLAVTSNVTAQSDLPQRMPSYLPVRLTKSTDIISSSAWFPRPGLMSVESMQLPGLNVDGADESVVNSLFQAMEEVTERVVSTVNIEDTDFDMLALLENPLDNFHNALFEKPVEQGMPAYGGHSGSHSQDSLEAASEELGYAKLPQNGQVRQVHQPQQSQEAHQQQVQPYRLQSSVFQLLKPAGQPPSSIDSSANGVVRSPVPYFKTSSLDFTLPDSALSPFAYMTKSHTSMQSSGFQTGQQFTQLTSSQSHQHVSKSPGTPATSPAVISLVSCVSDISSGFGGSVDSSVLSGTLDDDRTEVATLKLPDFNAEQTPSSSPEAAGLDHLGKDVAVVQQFNNRIFRNPGDSVLSMLLDEDLEPDTTVVPSAPGEAQTYKNSRCVSPTFQSIAQNFQLIVSARNAGVGHLVLSPAEKQGSNFLQEFRHSESEDPSNEAVAVLSDQVSSTLSTALPSHTRDSVVIKEVKSNDRISESDLFDSDTMPVLADPRFEAANQNYHSCSDTGSESDLFHSDTIATLADQVGSRISAALPSESRHSGIIQVEMSSDTCSESEILHSDLMAVLEDQVSSKMSTPLFSSSRKSGVMEEEKRLVTYAKVGSGLGTNHLKDTTLELGIDPCPDDLEDSAFQLTSLKDLLSAVRSESMSGNSDPSSGIPAVPDFPESASDGSVGTSAADVTDSDIDSGDIRSDNNKNDENAGKDVARGSKRPPAKVLAPCRVCIQPATGIHYGVNTCEACKGFFRRSLLRKKPYKCKGSDKCNVQETTRSTCASCRYKRCLAVGMSQHAIKIGRYSNDMRTQHIKQAERERAVSKGTHSSCPNISDSDLDDLVARLVAADKRVFTNTDVPDDAIESRSEEVFKAYKLQKETFGLNLLSNEEYQDIYRKTGLDVDGRKALIVFYARCVERSIRNFVRFTRDIPGFISLSPKDQVNLLKSARVEFWFLGAYRGFHPKYRTFYAPNGVVLNPVQYYHIAGEDLLDNQFRLAERMRRWDVTREELVLVKAVCLTYTDRCTLENPEKVQQIQYYLLKSLYLQLSRRPQGNPSHALAKALDYLVSLRDMTESQFRSHSRELVLEVLREHPVLMEVLLQ